MSNLPPTVAHAVPAPGYYGERLSKLQKILIGNYEPLIGVRVVVRRVIVIAPCGRQDIKDIRDPQIAEILPTSPEHLFCVCDGWADPRYEISLINPSIEIEDGSKVFVKGKSYFVGMHGETHKPDFDLIRRGGAVAT